MVGTSDPVQMIWTRRVSEQAARRGCRAVGSLALVLACASFAGVARANGPIGRNGESIKTSRYSIDLFQGPVFAGSRVTSLGGAYVAIAWDVDGMLQNPAAPAVRPFFSVTHFDYWLGFGLTFPASLEDMDYFNTGSKTQIPNSPTSMVFMTPAAMFQFGAFGFGVNLELQNYGLGNVTSADGVTARLSTGFNVVHVQAAYAFGRGELVLGLGSRILDMEVRTREQSQSSSIALQSIGTGIEIGALWKPRGERFSFGGAFRSAINTTTSFSDAAVLNDAGDVVFGTDLGQFYLPTQAILPWDVNLGVAVEIGADPLNKPWSSERHVAERTELRLRLRMLEREDARNQELALATSDQQRKAILARYAPLDAEDVAEIDAARTAAYWAIQEQLARAQRRHVVVAASALISGQASNAVGIESFLSQTINRSGQNTSVSLRLGAEMEVIPDWVRVRTGTYLEPTRFETSSPRAHYTGGFDVRAVNWNVFGLWPDDYIWRLGVGGDVSHNYSSVSVTIAGWYPRHKGEVDLPIKPQLPEKP